MRHKQRGVIEFLTAENVPLIDIHRRLTSVYGEESVVDVAGPDDQLIQNQDEQCSQMRPDVDGP